jgi:integrase
MAGKQAKMLTRQQVVLALRRARRGRYPRRDRVMILLSVKAGLRAGEIAKGPYSNYDCDWVGGGSTNFEVLGAIV